MVTATLAHNFLPAEATLPTDRQRLFVLFFVGTLIDLVVLGLFSEFSEKVYVDTFSTALLAAIVLPDPAQGDDRCRASHTRPFQRQGGGGLEKPEVLRRLADPVGSGS